MLMDSLHTYHCCRVDKWMKLESYDPSLNPYEKKLHRQGLRIAISASLTTIYFGGLK